MDSITEMISIRTNQYHSLRESHETVENDAYLHSCKCPECNKRIFRGSEERTFYCENCGTKLHQRAFTQEEIDDALFQHEMDTYED